MSKSEVIRVLSFLTGIYLLIGQLLYGCGMRISECLRLRIKDIDFDQMLIEIHNSKGDKSRFVPLPRQLVEPLRRLVEARRALHERDMANGEASVWLPHALEGGLVTPLFGDSNQVDFGHRIQRILSSLISNASRILGWRNK